MLKAPASLPPIPSSRSASPLSEDDVADDNQQYVYCENHFMGVLITT